MVAQNPAKRSSQGMAKLVDEQYRLRLSPEDQALVTMLKIQRNEWLQQKKELETQAAARIEEIRRKIRALKAERKQQLEAIKEKYSPGGLYEEMPHEQIKMAAWERLKAEDPEYAGINEPTYEDMLVAQDRYYTRIVNEHKLQFINTGDHTDRLIAHVRKKIELLRQRGATREMRKMKCCLALMVEPDAAKVPAGGVGEAGMVSPGGNGQPEQPDSGVYEGPCNTTPSDAAEGEESERGSEQPFNTMQNRVTKRATVENLRGHVPRHSRGRR